MAKAKYQCAACGREFFGHRSICRDCEKKLHHSLHRASQEPHGVRRMERL